MNPFISLLAGVAGAAVYDRLKEKKEGGMAKVPLKKVPLMQRPLNRDGQPSPQHDYMSYFYWVEQTYQPLLDQLEIELAEVQESRQFVAEQEIYNVEYLMNQLVQGLASNAPTLETQAIKAELDWIARGGRPMLQSHS